MIEKSALGPIYKEAKNIIPSDMILTRREMRGRFADIISHKGTKRIQEVNSMHMRHLTRFPIKKIDSNELDLSDDRYSQSNNSFKYGCCAAGCVHHVIEVSCLYGAPC